MVKQPKILYIDDDELSLFLFKKLCDNNNFNVITSSSPTQGLNLLNKGAKFDYIISDYKMPDEMDGIEFLIKAKKYITVNTKLVLTSNYRENDIGYNLDLLNAKFLRKPISSSELILLFKNN